MVMLRTTEPVTYDLFDEQGHALGQVVLPREATIVGLQAGTVLLRREPPRMRSSVQQTEAHPRAA